MVLRGGREPRPRGQKTYETWQQGLLQIFEAVQDNKPFILNVYRSVSREQVENYLYRITYDLLEGVVEEQAQGMSVRQEDKAFIATLYNICSSVSCSTGSKAT